MSFSSPAKPKAEPTPLPPTIDDARESLESRDKVRRRRGRAATILSSNGPEGSTGAAALLGS